MTRWLLALVAWVGMVAVAPAQISDEDLLMPGEAFQVEARLDGERLVLDWRIAEGYYLYRSKFRFRSDTPGVSLGDPDIPPGKVKHDEFFGDVEVFRGTLGMSVPVSFEGSPPGVLSLEVVSQGCADIGVCYPPYTHALDVDVPPTMARTGVTEPPPASPSGEADPLDALARLGQSLGLGADDEQEFLDPDVAFVLGAEASDGRTVVARWDIAEGYYLYRDKFKFTLRDGDGVVLGEPALPAGKVKEDEYFGRVEVYHVGTEATISLTRPAGGETRIALDVQYQGCADAGLCYPPITKTVELLIPAAMAQTGGGGGAVPAVLTTTAPAPEAFVSEQDRLLGVLQEGSLLSAALLFFGLGLLLAFTPCVFPMVPILSSIIVGQGHDVGTRKAFILSLVYVLPMALTYTVIGVIAGQTGAGLQAIFQEPWILVSFSAVFVLLSLSMFGFYDLQVPASWQAKLAAVSNRQEGGTYLGVAMMGFLSALIVGPCVAAPLVAALVYIGQSGDSVLGGTALFALSMGMGAPLLALGASAGKLLPKAGPWMETVKAVFGVMMLGLAIYFMERILPGWITLLLWAALFIVAAIYMGALDPLGEGASGWRRLWKGSGLVMLVYGVLLMVGASGGGDDVFQPLKNLNFAGGQSQPHELEFRQVKGVAGLQAELDRAMAERRPVMLDYYADWCVSCKELEKYTFSDPGVQAVLANTILLQTDVTANDEQDQALLKHFGLFGPPAILFFGPDGQERTNYRVVGFMNAEQFRRHAQNAQG